jgi:FkbM family methyltransferase
MFTNEPANTSFKIANFFKDKPNGVFVEAGALDGVFQSNTLALEQKGWTGLLVEPLHNHYLDCINNRTSPVENCALVSFDYKKDTITINPDWVFSKITNGNGMEVSAKTLASLLEKHNITHIDFFSLDVEGYEKEVLNGMNFNSVSVNYFLIEINTNEYSLEEMDSFMLSKGFKNIANVSYFTPQNTPTWPGNHQDYLYKNIAI